MAGCCCATGRRTYALRGGDPGRAPALARRACVGKKTIYRWRPSNGAAVLEAASDSPDPVVVYPDSGDVVAGPG